MDILKEFDDIMRKIGCDDKELRKKFFIVFCNGLHLGHSCAYDSELCQDVEKFFEKNKELLEHLE